MRTNVYGCICTYIYPYSWTDEDYVGFSWSSYGSFNENSHCWVDCRDLALKKKIVSFFETVTLHVIDPFKGPFISAAVTHTRQLSFAARL